MQICVVGFYGHKDFCDLLKTVKYPVTVISHNEVNDYSGLSTINIPNIGLEFGAYDYYLKNVWTKGSVLFMHDDMTINDISVFDGISKLEHDCSYIFRDMAEEKANGGKHGRAIYCSERFLNFIKNFECDCMWCEEKEDIHHNKGHLLPRLNPHKGFWFDPYNKGHIGGKPPIGIRHYNDAIYHFHWTLGRIRDQKCGPKEMWPNPEVKMNVVNRPVFDDMVAGRRNCWKHIEREIARYGA